MKKALFVFSIVALLLVGTAAYTQSAEDPKILHIQQTYDKISTQFYRAANREMMVDGLFWSVEDKTNPKEHYYLAMLTNERGIITMLIASVQIEMDNDVVEVRNEGLIKQPDGSYKYTLERRLIFRNDNCRVEEMDNLKEGIWDAVLNRFFNK